MNKAIDAIRDEADYKKEYKNYGKFVQGIFSFSRDFSKGAPGTRNVGALGMHGVGG